MTGRNTKRWILGLWPLAAMLLAAPVQAQPPGLCHASLSPLAAREGGTSELIGDVVIDCAGNGGQSPARLEILLVASIPLSNQDLSPETDPAWGLTDALLLVDDPMPEKQKVCVLADSGATCPDDGGHTVFQGRRLQENLIAFQAIPALPAAAGASRRFRIVNLRRGVAVDKINPDLEFPDTLEILIFSGGKQIQVDQSLLTLAEPQTPFRFSVLTSAGTVPEPVVVDEVEEEVEETESAEPIPGPALQVLTSKLPARFPDSEKVFRVSVREEFPSALRRRAIATTASDPSRLTDQALPGVVYGTETGFYNPKFPVANGLSTAGRASSGSRLMVTFHDIPTGVEVWAHVEDQAAVGGTQTTPRALMTRSDSDGKGSYFYFHPEFGKFAKLSRWAGDAYAVWEIVSANPSANDEYQFLFALTTEDGVPADVGEASVTVELVPRVPATAATDLIAMAGSPTFAQIEEEKLEALPAFTVMSTPNMPPAKLMSAASGSQHVSPGSIATLTGTELALTTEAANLPVAMLAGTSVTIIDSGGAERPALLYLVSPGQINLVIDPATRVGPALLNIWRDDELVGSSAFAVDTLAPALFSADGSGTGYASGLALSIGNVVSDQPATLSQYVTAEKSWYGAPLQAGDEAAPLYVVLYGTGFLNRGDLSTVRGIVGGETVPAIWAAPRQGLPGLDQITVGPLPASVRGLGDTPLVIQAGDLLSNAVNLHFVQ